MTRAQEPGRQVACGNRRTGARSGRALRTRGRSLDFILVQGKAIGGF